MVGIYEVAEENGGNLPVLTMTMTMMMLSDRRKTVQGGGKKLCFFSVEMYFSFHRPNPICEGRVAKDGREKRDKTSMGRYSNRVENVICTQKRVPELSRSSFSHSKFVPFCLVFFSPLVAVDYKSIWSDGRRDRE